MYPRPRPQPPKPETPQQPKEQPATAHYHPDYKWTERPLTNEEKWQRRAEPIQVPPRGRQGDPPGPTHFVPVTDYSEARAWEDAINRFAAGNENLRWVAQRLRRLKDLSLSGNPEGYEPSA